MYTHASGRQSETAYAIPVLFTTPMERAKINLYKKLATAAKKYQKKSLPSSPQKITVSNISNNILKQAFSFVYIS